MIAAHGHDYATVLTTLAHMTQEHPSADCSVALLELRSQVIASAALIVLPASMLITDPFPEPCLAGELPAAALSGPVDIRIGHFQPMPCQGHTRPTGARPMPPLFVRFPCRRYPPICVASRIWGNLGLQS